jgi:L-alanine-DL-glutamate epimerase-like enolase superfamily enzyme
MVRITTNDGRQGWVQIAPYDAHISAQVLHEKVARHALGQDLSEIDSINDRVIDANMKYPWAYTSRALGGIDTAIWDLYGKIKEKPVCELIGGKAGKVRAYGSSMRRDISPQEEGERLARLRDEQGFRAFKIRLGIPTGHNADAAPGRSEVIIPTVRAALGGDVDIFADANSCYTPDKAIEMGRRLEDSNYAMFEEPCPYWELEWSQEVTAALDIAVSGGEQDNDMAQWRRMINMRAVDILQPDICYVGGITRAMRVAKMGLEKGLIVKPHAANLSMVTIFTMHMLTAVPNSGELEFSIEYGADITRQAREMFSPAIVLEDGHATISHEPGWGVTINDEWLAGANHQATEST